MSAGERVIFDRCPLCGRLGELVGKVIDGQPIVYHPHCGQGLAAEAFAEYMGLRWESAFGGNSPRKQSV